MGLCRFAFGLLALAMPASAFGWGENGHIVTASIAERHLSEKAKAAIKELIGDRSIADKSICVWADMIRGSAMYRRKYPDNSTWHYINLEVKDEKPDPTAKEFNERNVLAAIEKFRKVVKDKSVPLEDRKEALFLLVHFVSDLHQPLHCGSRNDDKGGNRVMVLFPGKGDAALRLHGVWDTEIVHEALGGLTAADYATRLNDRHTDEERKKAAAGEVKDWVLESHRLARDKVYADIPADWPLDGKAFELSRDYVKRGVPVVEQRLLQGGIRLAKLLNEVFRD